MINTYTCTRRKCEMTMKKFFSLIICILIAVSAISVNIVSGADTVTLMENALFIDGYPDKTFQPVKQVEA